MSVSTPPRLSAIDEVTPLVMRGDSDGARQNGFSRKAKFAVVGSLSTALLVYGAQRSSSTATASLGNVFSYRGANVGAPGGLRHSSSVDAVTHEMHSLEQQYAGLNNKLHQLSTENDELKEQLSSLKAKTEVLSEVCKKAETEAQEAQEDMVGCAQERDAVKAQIGQISAEGTEKSADDSEYSASLAGNRASSFAGSDTPDCDETLYGEAGAGYQGCQTHTRSGLECQAWDAQTPHQHSHDQFTSETLKKQKNHCRNPDGGDGIWCYTTDPNVRFDYCDPLPVEWDYFCAHEDEGLCECGTSNDGVLVFSVRDGDAGTELDWENSLQSGKFAVLDLTKPKPLAGNKKFTTQAAYEKAQFKCSVETLGVDPGPGVAKSCWCAPRDAIPVRYPQVFDSEIFESVAFPVSERIPHPLMDEGAIGEDEEEVIREAPAEGPGYAEGPQQGEYDDAFAPGPADPMSMTNLFADGPGSHFQEFVEDLQDDESVKDDLIIETGDVFETVEAEGPAAVALEEFEEEVEEETDDRKPREEFDKVKFEDESEDYTLDVEDEIVPDPYAVAPASDSETIDPMAFTDAPDGYEALAPDSAPRRPDANSTDSVNYIFKQSLEQDQADVLSGDMEVEIDDGYVEELLGTDDDSDSAEGPVGSYNDDEQSSDGYPGTQGCEQTCEGLLVTQSDCESMFYCHFDEKDGKCWSAVGSEPCPLTEQDMFDLWDAQREIQEKHAEVSHKHSDEYGGPPPR